MGKYLSVLLGIAAMVIGFWALRVTWPLLWTVCKVVIPLVLVLGGGMAVLVGLGEISDSLRQRTPKS